AHVERGPSGSRAAVQAVAALPGVVAVVDVEADRVVGHHGVDDDDTREVVAHFTETWWELLNALLPVLGDAMGLGWTPGRWWGCAGGDYVALGRAGRGIIVEQKVSGPFLTAVAGAGEVEGTQVW
ncbi:MAG: hypothetical protein ACRDYV_10690, partial [Acidimicrobiia bacterium]